MARRSPGDGSLYQRRDGLWVAQHNGQYSYSKDKDKARAKLHKLLTEAEEVKPENITVGKYLDRWFDYAYAVFHSPTYRERYAGFLKRDFPRLPLTFDRTVFAALAENGAELVGLHLMTSPALDNLITRFPEDGDNTVERVRYDAANQRVYINKVQYFEGVAPEVWQFRVGGYQVLDKWLKDRKGRTLSFEDIMHYQRIVVALLETRRIMQEIDDLIPGWPLA